MVGTLVRNPSLQDETGPQEAAETAPRSDFRNPKVAPSSFFYYIFMITNENDRSAAAPLIAVV